MNKKVIAITAVNDKISLTIIYYHNNVGIEIETHKYMIKKTLFRLVTGLTVFTLVIAGFSQTASAAQITGRSVTIGTSLASASTTYSFTFTVPSSTVIQSAAFEACTTASGACSTPAGFSVASSTLTAQPTNLGDASGWTVSTATAGSLRLSKSGNVAAPTGAQTVGFSNVVNPSATNSTFFFRMTTYSAANWTSAIDTGIVATSTAGQITVTASVDETLTFTLAAATAALGVLSSASTSSATSTMSAGTNAATGYNITVNGSTIAGLTTSSSPITSSIGTSQFGLNVVDNATPNVGSNPSGGSGTFGTGYGTVDSYKFLTGSTIATASVPTATTTFTVSYIANITTAIPAGSYSTVLTYIATANF
jgi:hypothetical protein